MSWKGEISIRAVRYFHDLPLRKKIQLVNLLVILPTILLFTITLYQMNRDQTEERALRSSQQEMKLIANTLNTVFTTIENFSKLEIINKSYQSVLKSTLNPTDELQRLEDVQQMYASLNAFLESNSYMDSVVVQSMDGRTFYYSNNLSNITEYTLRSYPREELLSAKGSAVWIETFESRFLVNDEHKQLISLGRRIMDMNNGQVLGFLFINIDERKLAQLFGTEGSDTRSRVMLLNAQGRILSAQDADQVHQRVDSELWSRIIADKADSLVSTELIPNSITASKVLEASGWRIVYEVPMKALMEGQWRITWFIIGFGLAGLLLSSALSIMFSRWVTKPIIQLSRTMAAVGRGNLQARSPIGSSDEVGQLAHRFNGMVSRIQELLVTINEEERQKRLLELRLLYSQIKPHFLYNTLEMIRSMAFMVQAQDISKAVKALGDFYRMSLNKGQELIPVAQERKHLESYLTIQKLRYQHIHYRIAFDPAMEVYRIPNMLLQPLVENAIYHGLREKQHDAMCEIIGEIENYRGDPVLSFRVKDNGAGMNDEQIRRMWKQDRTDISLSSFGIRSIQERIQLRCGLPYGLTLHSAPGEGVEIRLRLPLNLNTDGKDLEEGKCSTYVS